MGHDLRISSPPSAAPTSKRVTCLSSTLPALRVGRNGDGSWPCSCLRGSMLRWRQEVYLIPMLAVTRAAHHCTRHAELRPGTPSPIHPPRTPFSPPPLPLAHTP